MVNFSDIYGIRPNHDAPAKGKILVANPLIMEKYFKRSVVYIIEEGKDDMYAGVVLNKKSKYTLADIVSEAEDFPEIPVYRGGPVGMNNLFYLHCLGNMLTGSVHIGGNIYMGMEMLPVISYMSAGNRTDGFIKFFLGFSGWSPGQLKMEIATDSWGVGNLPYPYKCLKYDEELWRKSVLSLGSGYASWLRVPPSYSYN